MDQLHVSLTSITTTLSTLVPSEIASIESAYLWELYEVLRMDVARIDAKLEKSIQRSLQRQSCMQAEIRQLETCLYQRRVVDGEVVVSPRSAELKQLKLRLKDQMSMLRRDAKQGS